MKGKRPSLFLLCVWVILSFVVLSASARADSPYGDILKSINKEQPQQKSPPQPSQKQQPAKPTQPTQPQAAPQPPKLTPTPPMPKPMSPPPSPLAPMAAQPKPSLQGKNIRANLELKLTVSDSLSDTQTKREGSRSDTTTSQESIDGFANVSLAFEEAAVFPTAGAQSPTALVAIGNFNYSCTERSSGNWQYSGTEGPVLGSHVYHPTASKGGAYSGGSQDESTLCCKGVKTYEGAKYVTLKSKAVTVPGIGAVPASQMQALDMPTILNLQEEPNGMTRYRLDLTMDTTCTTKSGARSSVSGSTSSNEKVSNTFTLAIEGTFPKGQKSVQIKPENVVDQRFPSTIETGGKSKKLNVAVSGTLTFMSQPGKMQVTPDDSLASSGPDDKNKFSPSSKTYVLKNTGESAIKYSVSKTQNWLGLSAAEGTLESKHTANIIVSINEQVAKTLKPGDYKDTVTFTNVTSGTGNTTRQATLSTVEEQTWRVSLSGQETDDVGGQLMYMKVKDKWKYQVVEYGVRFNYTKLTAEFTIKKVQGKWKYKEGKITSASVTPVQIFDSTVFFVKNTACRNCDKVNGLAGSSIAGKVYGNTVRLIWPGIITTAVVQNKLKLEHNSKDESHKGYSANEFYSECFFDYACKHDLPLNEGELKPLKEERRSHVNQYRQDKKKPIYLYHQYFMKRIK